jgi:hypothetical protein
MRCFTLEHIEAVVVRHDRCAVRIEHGGLDAGMGPIAHVDEQQRSAATRT